MTKGRSEPCDSLILENNAAIGHNRILPRHAVSLSFVVRTMPGFQQASGPRHTGSVAFLGGRRRIFLMGMRTFGTSEVAFIHGVAGCDRLVLHVGTVDRSGGASRFGSRLLRDRCRYSPSSISIELR